MSDTLTPAQRSYNMSRIHSKNTTPELALRRSLWHRGYRYRLNDRRLPGTPDIVLPKYRSVIFINGCFWHGHEGCKNYTVPKTNTDFWVAKVARNQERDQEVWRQLEAKGWSVIIVWECELKKKVLCETVERVFDELAYNKKVYTSVLADKRRSQATYRSEQKAKKEKKEALKVDLCGLIKA